MYIVPVEGFKLESLVHIMTILCV